MCEQLHRENNRKKSVKSNSALWGPDDEEHRYYSNRVMTSLAAINWQIFHLRAVVNIDQLSSFAGDTDDVIVPEHFDDEIYQIFKRR